ncbi:MAG TPA: hypothetical protein VHF26_09200, partial [Trebonia sp.]|nr:hypothetical protein [Trebonia sp.]
EYNRNAGVWPNTGRCLREAHRLGFTQANFTILAEHRFALAAWVPLERIEDSIVRRLPGAESWGDVFVR